MSKRALPGRRVGVLSTAAAVALTVPVAVVALGGPADAATPVAGGTYTLANGASGKCIVVTGAGTDNGVRLAQVACDAGAPAQQFRAVSQNGAYGLTNLNSGKCIDVPNYSSTTGEQLWQWTCGTSTNQTWTLTPSNVADKFLIRSNLNNLCIANKDGSTAGNNPIIQEPCADTARMQWRFNPTGSTPTTPPSGGTSTVASDGSGTYRTVQEAVDAVPANNTTRRVITIKPGTYRQVVRVPSNKPNITFQGLGSSPSNTTIVYHNSAHTSGTSGSASMFVDGANFVAENLTISNDYDENTYETGDQAVALHLNADRAVLRNVRLLGDQDTFLVNDRTRAYVVNSYIEGTTDFVFGGGTVVFNACTVHEKRSSGGTMTAASTDAAKTYGFLFYRSTITGAGSNNTTLGRPWRQGAQVLYRESNLSSTVKNAQPWTNMGDATWQNARFSEYRNTGAGATVNGNRPQLSDAQAATYTPQRYLAGSDGWTPM
ncbi:pectinesterase family protein [Micromonospora robiginosa]|uniref:Pectinesterase n=1 Tax=Micromonospora robiginosa TaxID=2749844 RepID=A0A7L6B4M5_9ACTN|nr:pectinesterase family protein [Micromonospora ferruginea]QLQ36540.1 pectinesterase family protein [Micromonospora ferruginea]